MTYRMLVADLDGTALNSQDRLAAPTLDALRRCRTAGWRVILATGRCYRTALPVIRQLALPDPVICNNGSLVKDPADDRTLHATVIDPQAVRRAIAAIADAGQSASLHVDGFLDGIDFAFLRGRDAHPSVEQFLTHFHGHYRPLAATDDEALQRCMAISVVGGDEGLQRCRRAVDDALDSQVRTLMIAAPNLQLRLFEIFAAGVNKWAAASRLAEDFGIARHEIVAIGDDVNDVEMVREAGLGIAMGNAAAAVLQVADRLAPPTDANGLAAVLNHLLDTGEVP